MHLKDSYTIVILGASGDLTKKKLLPACYQLFQRQTERFIVVGAALDQTDSAAILTQAEPYVHHKDQQIWEDFQQCVFYQPLDFHNLADYKKLAHALDQYEADFELSGNRLIYLAASADYYCEITKNLALSGIAFKETAASSKFFRIVYEKPFGWDGASAEKINTNISNYFTEEQVYRVDHYLTKSLVNSIARIRFANILFEPLWNHIYIDHVQILLSETDSIGLRSQFYDKYGALKDVVQNHMLQLLSLIAMEKPEALTAYQVSNAKIEVLSNTRIIDGILGQYRGYDIKHKNGQQSTTETFAQLRLEVNTDRWTGVPFYLKTGKNLNYKSTEIHIVFKAISRNFFNTLGSFEPNILTIRISPNSGFSLQLNTQKAGVLNQTSTVKMDFCYQCLFGEFPHAYEVLIKEIINGEKSIAVSSPEIEYAWRIIDQAKLLQLPLYSYEPGSAGPEEAEKFNEKNCMRWIV